MRRQSVKRLSDINRLTQKSKHIQWNNVKTTHENTLYLKEAFTVYNHLDTSQRNDHVVNTMLSICLQCNGVHQVTTLHNDILKHQNISTSLLLKSCKQLLKMNNKTHCISLLHHLMNTTKSGDIRTKTTLIDICSECAQITHALQIFNSIPSHQMDVVCVGAMMKCLINHHQNEDALALYSTHAMEPNNILKHLYLKAIINISDYKNGYKFMDENIDKHTTNHSIQLLDTMIQFYGKSGNMQHSLDLFQHPSNTMTTKSTIFNLIMKYYIRHNEHLDAVAFYDKYSSCNGVLLDDMSYVSYLKALMHVQEWDKAQHFITHSIDIHQHKIELIHTLIDFYGAIEDMDSAWNLFNNIHSNKKDIVSINVMMKALLNNKSYDDALSIYEKNSHKPNDISRLLYLKCCMKKEDFSRANTKIMSTINHVNDHSIEFINTLIEFYGYFGEMERAQHVFDSVNGTKRNIRTLNAMLKCYCNAHQYEDAFKLFEQCPFEYNDVSYVLYLKCCVGIGDYVRADTLVQMKGIHKRYDNNSLMNILIDLYGKMDRIEDALFVFDHLQSKDLVSINTMMSAYNRCGCFEKALDLFFCSKQIGFEMDSFCYGTALLSCGHMVSLSQGLDIISLINEQPDGDVLLNDVHVQSAIIAMYSKCGEFDLAIQYCREDINDDARRNKVVCGALMDCYSKIGDIDKVLCLYSDLKEGNVLNIHRDHGLFCMALNACSHSGVIEEALRIFEEIQKETYLHPNIITALVDCFGRTNHLNTAEHLYHQFCNTMGLDHKTRLNILKSLVSSSSIHCDHARAQRIQDEISLHN
eukprot:171225_1